MNCRVCRASCVPHSTICLGCRTRWVAQSSSFDSEHSSPQSLAQHCSCSPDLCLRRGGGCQLAQGVPNEEQMLSNRLHLLPKRHEEAWGLVGPGAEHQGHQSCLQCRVVALALPNIEVQELLISMGQKHRVP